MKNLVWIWVTVFLFGCVKQGPMTSCDECKEEDLKAYEQLHEAEFTAAMQQTLTQLFQQKAAGLKDPDKVKAMQVLAKTDAAKSYAFTQIYAVSARYCGPAVQQQLNTYQTRAANIIALGQYYYQQGIEAQIGDRDLSQTGEALTAALQEMTDQLVLSHEQASDSQLQQMCQEAEQVLGSLIWLYGS